MSIEEKAEEYRSNTFGTPFKNDIKMAFSEGAQWMLKKVLDYIDNNVVFNKFGETINSEGFIKAMKDE